MHELAPPGPTRPGRPSARVPTCTWPLVVTSQFVANLSMDPETTSAALERVLTAHDLGSGWTTVGSAHHDLHAVLGPPAKRDPRSGHMSTRDSPALSLHAMRLGRIVRNPLSDSNSQSQLVRPISCHMH